MNLKALKNNWNILKTFDFISNIKDESNEISILYNNKILNLKIYFTFRNKITYNFSYDFQNNTEKISKKYISNYIENFEWGPSTSIKDFIEKMDEDINKKFNKEDLKKKNQDEENELLKPSNFYLITFLIHLFSLFLKSATGLYGYSGKADPPKYGDYEAQRHWMELTHNLNASQWYVHNNITNPNDYWPLDYPPMSGYFAYIWGFLFNLLIPKSMVAKSSWGYESTNHLTLMRISVIISDMICFHLPVYLLINKFYLYKKKVFHLFNYYVSSFIILCSPLLIIIDHGHFQYNCVMHGLFILSVYFLFSKFFILSILSFVLCVNFKQMGLYYALVFPIYVIKVLFFETKTNGKIFTFIYIIIHVIKYAVCSIMFLFFVWHPFIISDTYNSVIERVFPVWRGVFEDKVASFWCILNIVYKIKNIQQNKLILISLALTLFSSFFSLLVILAHKKPSKKVTSLAFFNVSLSFFLFSFHVHEKTILVPFLAYLLNLNTIGFILPNFSTIALFSLYPLLKREEQHIPYFIFLIGFYILLKYIIQSTNQNQNSFLKKINTLIEYFNLIMIICYHFVDVFIPAPLAYPWLYPIINSFIAFINFIFFYFVSNLHLLEIFLERKIVNNDNLLK